MDLVMYHPAGRGVLLARCQGSGGYAISRLHRRHLEYMYSAAQADRQADGHYVDRRTGNRAFSMTVLSLPDSPASHPQPQPPPTDLYSLADRGGPAVPESQTITQSARAI